jgi:hypothetical protein
MSTTVEPHVLTNIATCVRTTKDAEILRDEILKNGYEKYPLQTLYRAVLAVLGDKSALNLPEPGFSVATAVYQKMKSNFIANSECRCLRNATGGVLKNLTTCPVHGQKPGARLGMRNFGGMIR